MANQSPSREAYAIRRDVNIILAQLLAKDNADLSDRIVNGNEACDAILALLPPTPQQSATGEVRVEQRHRDAAADLAQWLTDAQKEWENMPVWFAADAPRAFREGAFDSHDFVQAFARFERDHLTPTPQVDAKCDCAAQYYGDDRQGHQRGCATFNQPDADREANAREVLERIAGTPHDGFVHKIASDDAIRAMLAFADATRPEVSEPFGYWVEQKHADPVLLRKPAYIPEPSELRTVTPLFASTQPSQAIPDGCMAVADVLRIVQEEGPQNPESDWTDYARTRAAMRDAIVKRLNALAAAPKPTAAQEPVYREIMRPGGRPTFVEEAQDTAMVGATPVEAGLREARRFAATVKQELLDRATAYSIASIEREHFDRAILAINGMLRAALAAPHPIARADDDWQPIETAPYSEPVEVRVGHMVIEAILQPLASMTSDEAYCDQWQAVHEGEHPPCWSEGACWSSNVDEVESLQPTAWRRIARADDGEGRK